MIDLFKAGSSSAYFSVLRKFPAISIKGIKFITRDVKPRSWVSMRACSFSQYH
jgi:hypothetical protein